MAIFNFKLDQSVIFQMAKQAGMITEEHVRATQAFVRDIAIASEAKAKELASQKLHSTRQKYEDSLSFSSPEEHHYVLTLDKDAAYLEEGYPSFDMIKAGLASGAASKKSKDGFNYVKIPFEQKPAWEKQGHPENARVVQIGKTNSTTRGSLAADLKKLREAFSAQGTMDTVKDTNGNPAQGAVWTIRKNPQNPMWKFSSDITGQKDQKMLMEERISPLLSGITKIQTKVGKKTMSSYISWRTASDNPKRKPGTWNHPGFSGANIFPELQQWVVDQVSRHLQETFSGS